MSFAFKFNFNFQKWVKPVIYGKPIQSFKCVLNACYVPRWKQKLIQLLCVVWTSFPGFLSNSGGKRNKLNPKQEVLIRFVLIGDDPIQVCFFSNVDMCKPYINFTYNLYFILIEIFLSCVWKQKWSTWSRHHWSQHVIYYREACKCQLSLNWFSTSWTFLYWKSGHEFFGSIPLTHRFLGKESTLAVCHRRYLRARKKSL